MTARSAFGITLFALGLSLPLAAAAGDAVGQITSATGDVVATGADGTQRALSCGDSIYDGDTLSTGTDASVGVLSGDFLTQVPDASAVRFGQTATGAPDATLKRGSVRIIDAREGEETTARLAAGDAEVRVVGNDAEAYLLAEKIGPYAMFCEWDAPLDVTRNGEYKNAAPGQCVIAKPHEPLYVANAHDERISAADAETCPPDLGALATRPPHLSPLDTPPVSAAPPPLAWSNPAEGIGPPGRDACETPGAVCGAGSANQTGIIVVDEVLPGGGARPGSPVFPGAN